MKKIIVILAAFALSLPVLAGLDAYDMSTHSNLLIPQAITDGAAVTGTAVSVKSAKGRAALLFSIKGSSTGTSHGASIQLQESSTSGGTFSNVTDAIATVASTNAGALTALEVDIPTLAGWIRVVATSTGGADTVSAVISAPK